MTLTVSPAAACAVGPAVFVSPTCEITVANYDEYSTAYTQWKDEGGVSYQVAVITPKRSPKFSGYLERWRHSHKCVADEIELGEATRFQAGGGEGAHQATPPQIIIPPQITWSGVCAGGDNYIARAISVGKQVVEVQAYIGIRSSAPVREGFVRLLEQIRLSPAPGVK